MVELVSRQDTTTPQPIPQHRPVHSRQPSYITHERKNIQHSHQNISNPVWTSICLRHTILQAAQALAQFRPTARPQRVSHKQNNNQPNPHIRTPRRQNRSTTIRRLKRTIVDTTATLRLLEQCTRHQLRYTPTEVRTKNQQRRRLAKRIHLSRQIHIRHPVSLQETQQSTQGKVSLRVPLQPYPTPNTLRTTPRDPTRNTTHRLQVPLHQRKSSRHNSHDGPF